MLLDYNNILAYSNTSSIAVEAIIIIEAIITVEDIVICKKTLYRRIKVASIIGFKAYYLIIC